MWYKRKGDYASALFTPASKHLQNNHYDSASAAARWGSASLLEHCAPMVSSTIMGQVSKAGRHVRTAKPLVPYADCAKIMFLTFGLITIVTGLLLLLYLPDNPMTSRLTDREKSIAVARLRGDTTGIENKTFKPSQFVEALKDPRLWLMSLITTAINIPNAAVSVFQATIILG